MDSYKAEQVINGTFGEVWVDNDYMAEALELEAKISLETSEVKMLRTFKKGYKVTGHNGTGTLKLNKVTSYFLEKIASNLKAGKATRASITTNLDDPETLGAERIRLNDCVFTGLTLANWAAGKILEEDIPFTFSDFDIIESIAA